ncbi:TSUP family transporter [Hymenobacter sp. BT770]|uniref:TSUP family transporter n=1 Tax=Hymenobacter sp. BT770 TaxID=2886942 RepID=UPI001D110A81|nr:TSUP family transporter [Hymenobacter sp. BT770]MCC3155420.1 TSUP family transporter [Hymenobacter sp. BT770]MDO3417449.1 TSUP family transporter [Hymenobacter sp. BT770]
MTNPKSPHASPTTANALFPVFLRLEKFRVLLVGGGKVALEKLTAILHNSPETAVTVVAPEPLPALQALVGQHPRVQLHIRAYQDDDLEDQDFLFVATDDDELNHRIKAAAAARHLLTNVANAPDACDFYMASVVQKGDLKVAISTNGMLPTVAKRLRGVLEEALPGELHSLLQHMTVIRTRLTGDFASRIKALNAATAELAYGPAYESPATAYWRRIATGALVTFALFILINIASYYVTLAQVVALLKGSGTFYMFVAVGFAAQLIDGLLGMGYGVVSAISLMSLGLNPVAVSASIHTAEVFASGASGYQHYRFGNVNKRLFRVLLLPGVAGSISGALVLAHFGEQYANWVKPLLAVYLLILGIRILSKALRTHQQKRRKVKHAGWLAGAGGFLDSFGGGGWGPLVTSTLIATGRTPQYVIGTVSLVEFFVTFASAFTFFTLIGISHWQIVAGLIVGGVAAAPIAARLAGRIPTRWMFLGVGLMVICWSLWALRKLF